MTDTKREAPASLEKRAAALEIVLRRKADMPKNFVAEFTEHADDAWITANGAQMPSSITFLAFFAISSVGEKLSAQSNRYGVRCGLAAAARMARTERRASRI